ncbi:hypothetical protein PUP66_00375 [Pseudomonas chlororaphis]|jgi:hypothetical protein|uniref:hypothetical protein n=1 Tax=Pseudomonas chlororaphis TaxID=587753 RepID=UPI000789C5DC|nr:hypothetical protein [Pseudomonas chlororaphis]AMS15258.1 hypothetical protein A3218_13460 [Pseudomonas chlororaphis]WDH47357.1 hypothetical protein PUP66_00375 [Pseudomonas chlororaphis]WDH59204.1 hypothetical protein PUP56_00375 [Pseudomonas chlororaphis]WQE18461.1 hypothetical protein U0007_29365 [Pseudomonas chlororaphis]
MKLKIFAGAVVYFLVGVLYFFVHDFGVAYYKENMGGFTDRGAAIGGTAELTFYFFIFVNFVVFFVPKIYLKILLLVLMLGVVLFYFLPDNPVRAIAYGGLTASMSGLALVARLVVERWGGRN